MNWKEKLCDLESSFGQHKKCDWKPAVELVRNLVAKHPDDVELQIRAIYAVHNILVEEAYPEAERDQMAGFLKKCFEGSYQKFSENPEYLFFIGKILYIAEWYFGLNDDPEPTEEKLAFQMQKKAFEMEPDNKLYEWAYRFSKNEGKKAFTLSKQILFADLKWINWLKTKGFPGAYLMESLEYCYQHDQEIV